MNDEFLCPLNYVTDFSNILLTNHDHEAHLTRVCVRLLVNLHERWVLIYITSFSDTGRPQRTSGPDKILTCTAFNISSHMKLPSS